jgi:glutaredoxin
MADEKTGSGISIKIPNIKLNIWMGLSLILVILLVLSIVQGWGITGKVVSATGQELPANEAGQKAAAWISDYFSSQGQNITLKLINSTATENGIYKFTVELHTSQGNLDQSYYVTKDGKLFIPQVIDLTAQQQQQTQQNATETTKTDKPTVDLFVMGFCPYGVQAENLMKPVVDLLGTKADIKIRFIASVQGDTVDSVQSLHGATEAQEDLRQVCIMNYYNQATYWKYLMEIDNNCYGKINTRDATALDACWKSAATKAGVDVAKIQTCSNSTEGLNLLKADGQLTSQYGVSGSPTLIINGVTYSGSRTSDAFKQAICSAFTTQPSECNQALSSNSTAASGGCG